MPNKLLKITSPRCSIYGEIKVHQQLLEDGYKVSLNTVARYRQELGLKAVLAVKQVNTTIPIKTHKKYSYKLRGLGIDYANHVWSTDITYIKITGGIVYMVAIIDWHSKAVLLYKISNIMDSQLVMSVLNDALEKHSHPEIFNTDQGSQCTSEIHVQRLKNWVSQYLWMVKAEPQIISALCTSGEVQNVKEFI